MSFSQHLVLWVHVAFVIFTIGPVTLAIMSTPRYIRQRDVRIVRYLTRITFVFMLGSLGVLIAGMALASMLHKEGKPWIIVSATLFLVAILLLALIVRDQRKAVKALEEAAGRPADLAVHPAAETAAEHAADGTAGQAGEQSGAGEQDAAPAPAGGTAAGVPAAGVLAASVPAGGTAAAHLASVERGRIAMTGGLVSLIWLVILVLMVWNS